MITLASQKRENHESVVFWLQSHALSRNFAPHSIPTHSCMSSHLPFPLQERKKKKWRSGKPERHLARLLGSGTHGHHIAPILFFSSTLGKYALVANGPQKQDSSWCCQGCDRWPAVCAHTRSAPGKNDAVFRCCRSQGCDHLGCCQNCRHRGC